MNIRKIIMLILAISIMASTIVGCGNSNPNNENSTVSDTTTQSSIDETVEDTQQTSNIETENTDITQESDNQTSSSGVDLNAIVDEITSKIEWASLVQVEDEATISEFFNLDANNPNYKQLLVMQCPMSAAIAEIILIEADDVNSAMEDLEVRREKLINVDAYYPEHKEIAEQSIIGSNGNIAYFIASNSAEDSEVILNDYLNQ